MQIAAMHHDILLKKHFALQKIFEARMHHYAQQIMQLASNWGDRCKKVALKIERRFISSFMINFMTDPARGQRA